MPSSQLDPARIILVLVPMILSLTVHEWAHAWVAYRLGDDTAARQGRLTLNPLAHVDWVGTVFITAIGAMTGVPLVGWAKPVPVDPSRFRRGVDPRRGHALVSAAGPFSNLALALLSVLLLSLRLGPLERSAGVSLLLTTMALMNTSLFVLNLLPIPPLDGSRLLPRRFDGTLARIRPYGGILLMAIVMLPPLQNLVLGRPVGFLVRLMVHAFAPLGRLFGGG